MKAIALSIDVLRQMPRPATYMDELRACIVAEDESGLIVDADSPCYRSLVEKYRSYEPTADDLERTAGGRNFASHAPSRGMGDTVAKVLEFTGIAAIARRFAGGDCGCKQRQERLNARLPYRRR